MSDSVDERSRASLSRYFSVVRGEKPAKFLVAKRIAASFSIHDSVEDLWRQHSWLMKSFRTVENRLDHEQKRLSDISLPEQSLLDLKVELAGRILADCHFCTRACGVDRTSEQLGYCGCGSRIVVSSIFEHLGEEPELVPSGTIFTMGCTMRCRHCQNWTISQWVEKGDSYSPEQLAAEVECLHSQGCRNANLVGGEPTPWLPQWLETFRHVNTNMPIVWNSNSYYSQQTAELLAGFIDLYLLDFKYGSDSCAERISEASDYWAVCTRNHLEAKKNGEIIVRILVLPNHLECCTKPTVNWIADNLGSQTRINLMFQYRPEWKAQDFPELRRRLSEYEVRNAIHAAKKAGLCNLV